METKLSEKGIAGWVLGGSQQLHRSQDDSDSSED